MAELAIIGPTASGKSELALALAKEHDAYILSLDSLSVYKEIDIASAKPSKDELSSVRHYGVDVVYPNEHFDVSDFIKIYKQASSESKRDGKHLIITGGSSFYLKMLIDGLTEEPDYSDSTKERVKELLLDVAKAYEFLCEIDPVYASKIKPKDRYRIERALLIYFESKLPPSSFFLTYKREPILKFVPIYRIKIDRAHLREKIALRTQKMLESGLIDEVAYLIGRYGREPKCMKAIGIKETLEFLDGKIKKEELANLISTHTAQLAKRQETFNKTQFANTISASKEELFEMIFDFLKNSKT